MARKKAEADKFDKDATIKLNRFDPKDPFGLLAKSTKAAPVEPTSGTSNEAEPVVQLNLVPMGAMISTLTKENTVNDTTKPTAQEVAEAKAKEKVAAKQAKLDAAAKAKADKEEANKLKAEAKAKKAADAQAAKDAKAAETAEQKAAAKKLRDEQKAAGVVAEPGEGMSGALREKVALGLYVKGKNGQLRTNDSIALALESVAVTDMVPLLLETLGLAENPYPHLNQGQQSMNLRNRLRGAIRKEAKIENTDVVISLARLTEIRDAKFKPVEAKGSTQSEAAAETADADAETAEA